MAPPPAPARQAVLLAGGGTGGHITPALATAEALRAARPDLDVVFVGSGDGLEARMVPEAGYPLAVVGAAPLARRASRDLARAPVVVARAAWRVRRLARERRAVAACGFGGYVSAPLALGALLVRVPLVVHEQNAVPGLANRVAARWAAAVAVSVPGTEDRFGARGRVTVTGNPVRGDLAGTALPELRAEAAAVFDLDPALPTVLVFGGSLGARRLNDAAVGSGGHWPAEARLQVLHLTGRRDHERVAAAWASAGAGRLEVRCVDFVERMALAYAVADVAVCRAGASTVAELCVAGVPAVLVPYPHALADEQAANASALRDAGAAVVVPDAELDGPRLVAAVAPLLAEPARREAMAAAARRLGRPDAARELAEVVLAVAAPARRRGRGARG